MSIRPGLLASTSRVVLATRAAVAPAQRRAASGKSKKNALAGTAQAADEEAKKREQQLRRLPPGMDLSTVYSKMVLGGCYCLLCVLTPDQELQPLFQTKYILDKALWSKALAYNRDRYRMNLQRCVLL